MPEHQNGCLRQALANHPRHKREMIILNEYNRIVGIHLFARGVGEPLVHFLVIAPVFGAKCRARVGHVAKRPKPLIGETVVITLLFLLGRAIAAAADKIRLPAERQCGLRGRSPP